MIKDFVPQFDANREEIKRKIREAKEPSYHDLFRFVVEAISECVPDGCWREGLDPERITRIDDGDYQGTLVFIVGEQGYQPDRYYGTTVSYGSCSGCDTIQAIGGPEYDWKEDSYGELSEEQIEDYFTLALHMFQRMTEIGGGD